MLARKASSRSGPTVPFGVGPCERVAGAALRDELLLARDQVGVVGALHRGRAAGDRQHGGSQQRRRSRTAAGRAHPRARWAPRGRRAVAEAHRRGTLSKRRLPGTAAGRLRARAASPARRAPPRSRRGRRPPTTSARARRRTSPSRVRLRSVLAGLQPAGDAARRAPRTAPSSTAKDSQRAASGGTSRGERLAHLREPRVARR